VGQFAFSEWTGDGRLRDPRYLGLRNDKRPREIVRERPDSAL
jgi:bifunctional non-homologous end joining protein LigD